MQNVDIVYDCGICSHYHPWAWNGDCRDDGNRYTLDDLPDDVEIRTMGERLLADGFYDSVDEMMEDQP